MDEETYETLLLTVDGAVATVTLNRPQYMNALSGHMFDEMADLFRRLASDDAIRVILIHGAGERAFAGGADIRELAEVGRLSGEQFARRGQDIFNAIESCGKPVIACIEGFALGGGCELALACTLRIASQTAKLGQPEITLGLLPGYGGTQRLPRLIGRSRALKMMLTAERVGAEEALRIGLVEACMDAVRVGMEMPLERGLHVEAQLFGRLCGTSDKAEGTAAFLEKRPPIWSGQ